MSRCDGACSPERGVSSRVCSNPTYGNSSRRSWHRSRRRSSSSRRADATPQAVRSRRTRASRSTRRVDRCCGRSVSSCVSTDEASPMCSSSPKRAEANARSRSPRATQTLAAVPQRGPRRCVQPFGQPAREWRPRQEGDPAGGPVGRGGATVRAISARHPSQADAFLSYSALALITMKLYYYYPIKLLSSRIEAVTR